MRSEPSFPDLLACARKLAARITNETIPDAEMVEVMRQILFEGYEGAEPAWLCFQENLITKRETATLVMFHLSWWISDRIDPPLPGVRLIIDAPPTGVADEPLLEETEQALFET